MNKMSQEDIQALDRSYRHVINEYQSAVKNYSKFMKYADKYRALEEALRTLVTEEQWEKALTPERESIMKTLAELQHARTGQV